MGQTHSRGPAFPLKNYTSEIGPDNCGFMAKDASGTGEPFWVNSGSPGMSLRDWFAGMAMNGIVTDGYAGNGIMHEVEHPEICAENAYSFADAMLAEREKNNG